MSDLSKTPPTTGEAIKAGDRLKVNPDGLVVSAETEPLRIELRGEPVELSEDEAHELLRSLHRQFADRSAAERQAAREAGQVWIATYWRYQAQDTEECFSLKEAAEYLDGGEEYGTLSSESIRCPDGTVYTKNDLNYEDWVSLLKDRA